MVRLAGIEPTFWVKPLATRATVGLRKSQQVKKI
jgi:hypothetical protein